MIDPGIPANEWKTTLPVGRVETIGTVQPFAVKEVRAEGNRIAGRRIMLEFPKQLGEELSPETVGRWIKVEPAPPNLKFALENASVILRGDFDLGTAYRVSVAAGLPAREPIATTAPFQREVTFEKYESRLYFQDFAAHQYVRGTRELRLLALNVPRLRVSAKLFTGEAVATALKGYDKYQEHDEEQAPDESYQRVEVEGLPGEIIWEKEFAPDGAVDREQTVLLNWDEIVGPKRTRRGSFHGRVGRSARAKRRARRHANAHSADGHRRGLEARSRGDFIPSFLPRDGQGDEGRTRFPGGWRFEAARANPDGRAW